MALKIAVLCASAALIVTGIKSIKPEIALAVALAAGAAACILSLNELRALSEMFAEITAHAGIEDETMSVIMKACGIAIAGEYAAQVCRDTGEGALAQRIDFAVRIALLALASPLIRETVSMIAELGI